MNSKTGPQATHRRPATAGYPGLVLCSLFLFSGFVQAGPAIQHWTTENGARVYFFPAPQLPIIDIETIFDAGSARDDQLPGLARLTSELLDQGAGNMTADQIAERFDNVGARFSSASERDMATISLRTLSDDEALKPALETMAHILAEPSFPAASLERIRQNMLVDLQTRHQSPGDIASDAFYAALYRNHPYGSPPQGTEKSLSQINRHDVIAFHRRYYVANNAVVAIVGDLTRTEAENVADLLTASLPEGQAAPALPVVPPRTSPETIRIDFPSSQTHVLIGQPGMSRDDPDYFTLYVGNHVLGGSGFVSRITEEVREKRGLSYSAYSYFIPMHRSGPFMIGLQTRNDQTGTAIQVANDTVRHFVTDGPSTSELKASKQNITGGFPLRLSSNSKMVDYLGMIGFYRLPLDYLDTFTDKVEAVSTRNIRTAFKQRVHPETMVTVLVGGDTLTAGQ